MQSREINDVMNLGSVIPVIVIDDPDDAIPLAEALVAGGLRVLEITLRTPAGLPAISKIKAQVPHAVVGAGTVRTPQEFDQAVQAGSEFIVAPGFTPALVDKAKELNMPFLPGVNTPSEVMQLLELGLNRMKFFPAEAAGGTAMLKSMAGPLPEVKFCPTGGVGLHNAGDYLALPNVLCVGGTWMLEPEDIRNKNWAAIEEKAAAASRLMA